MEDTKRRNELISFLCNHPQNPDTATEFINELINLTKDEIREEIYNTQFKTIVGVKKVKDFII